MAISWNISGCIFYGIGWSGELFKFSIMPGHEYKRINPKKYLKITVEQFGQRPGYPFQSFYCFGP